MLFNSFGFIFIYLPIVALVFFQLGRLPNKIWAAGWLALASLFFYGYWDYRYVPLLLASICINYGGGLLILRAQSSPRKIWLILTLTFNLLLLSYYKYADFFIHTVNTIGDWHLETLDIILPIGISFYTFTQIAFLVDTYQGKVKEYNFTHYLLFVSYLFHP